MCVFRVYVSVLASFFVERHRYIYIFNNAIYLIINNMHNILNYSVHRGGKSGEASTGQSPLSGKGVFVRWRSPGGHSLCHGLPDGSNGGDGVLGQSSQSL